MSRLRKAILPAAALLATLAVPSIACSSSKPTTGDSVHVTAAPETIEIGSAPAGRLLLHLDGVRVAEGQAAVFRVFVNHPGATAATPVDHPAFVEELVLVPSRSKASEPGARAPGQNLVLPLPVGAVKPGERITVTLVPVGSDTQGQLTEPGTMDVTLKRPYVTVAR